MDDTLTLEELVAPIKFCVYSVFLKVVSLLFPIVSVLAIVDVLMGNYDSKILLSIMISISTILFVLLSITLWKSELHLFESGFSKRGLLSHVQYAWNEIEEVKGYSQYNGMTSLKLYLKSGKHLEIAASGKGAKERLQSIFRSLEMKIHRTFINVSEWKVSMWPSYIRYPILLCILSVVLFVRPLVRLIVPANIETLGEVFLFLLVFLVVFSILLVVLGNVFNYIDCSKSKLSFFYKGKLQRIPFEEIESLSEISMDTWLFQKRGTVRIITQDEIYLMQSLNPKSFPHIETMIQEFNESKQC